MTGLLIAMQVEQILKLKAQATIIKKTSAQNHLVFLVKQGPG